MIIVPDDRYIRTRKEDMPKGYLFNEAYYPPHGKNGHVYHVFVSLPRSPMFAFIFIFMASNSLPVAQNYPLHYKIPDYAPL